MIHALALNDYDALISLEVRILERDVAETEDEICVALREIAAHRAWMATTFADEIAAMQAAAIELQALKRKLQGDSPHESFTGGGEYQIDKPAPIKPNRSATREMKALYRSISQRCHPDKTDDPDLHALFEAAAVALAANDIDTLRMLKADLVARGGILRMTPHDLRLAKLKAKQRALQEAAARTIDQLDRIYRGMDWQSVCQYREMSQQLTDPDLMAAIRQAFQVQRLEIEGQVLALKNPRPTREFCYWQLMSPASW